MFWIKNKIQVIWQDITILNIFTSMIFLLSCLILLVFIVWWCMQQSIFSFKVIYVKSIYDTPLQHTNISIVRTIIPYINGNFFTIDLNKTSVLFQSIPWVRKAIVRRKWPNSLMILIEEHNILGTWGTGGRLLSVKGDIFTVNLHRSKYTSLLAFHGPEDSAKEIAERFIEFRDWLAPTALTFSTIIFSNRYGWRVKFNNSMIIELGRSKNNSILKERITRLVFVYPQLVRYFHGKILNVDLRYPNGFALKTNNYINCSQ